LEPAPNSPDLRVNNFDLLRLVAAFQVVLGHTLEHLEIGTHALFLKILAVLPGVPIFFFLSGFLISRTYERNPNLVDYFRNRALRLYPGLFVCFLVSICLVAASGYFSSNPAPPMKFAAWTVAQLTAFQFYNPDFLRGYGCGVLNGSLWTISVELQFYILTPLLYWFLKLNQNGSNCRLAATTAVFAIANYTFHTLSKTGEDSIAIKLLGVSFIPWFYMFLIGVLAQRNFDLVYRLTADRGLLLFLAYLPFALLLTIAGYSASGNEISCFLFLPLVITAISLAYTQPTIAHRMLGSNDISYGFYIYHMPLVNFMIEMGYIGLTSGAIASIVATFAFAVLSWTFVEKPSLRKKRNTLKTA
jgi:peptidoglycan/LPS O-acetylase OafA/YrhL